MHTHQSIRTAVILLALAGGAAGLGAYNLTGKKWASPEAPYYVNPANADVSESAALAAIQAGAMTWSAQSNANFAFYYMGRTSGSSAAYNGKNEVFFRNEADGGTIARTYWWYNSRNELLDADIMFLDGGWRFFTGSSGCSDGVYLEDIAAHEFGHALGLSHSSDSSATMYSKATRCGTNFRTLAPDDLAGVEKLYPSPSSGSNSAPGVTIKLPGNNASYSEGSSVAFSGSASDSEDGNLSSTIVWTSSRDGKLGTGASFSRVLTAGTHTITAKVSDSGGLTASRQVSVTITTTPPPNQAPAVSISAPSDGTTVTQGTGITFRGSATDAEDGDLTSKLVWNSSVDGTIGAGGSFSRVLSPGSHRVRATVTDSNGVSSYSQIAVSVAAAEDPAPSPSQFWLSATAVKVKGRHHGDLRWGGSSSTKIDIYRDGVKVGTTANDGTHRDAINLRGGGSYTYKVCAAGTTTCSNAAVISF